ncbi:leukocyte elastase inhibitor-like isoform X2 [Daktulosphaira vitifoliae]|nr:leukocyte elastase inhibitor-like isoform X2 [Daktulosphaira vitifoliae]XP_050526223.1 leukocyte elastase inhibitor-like isoform X2 [Daktulosphaira vitifoliae]
MQFIMLVLCSYMSCILAVPNNTNVIFPLNQNDSNKEIWKAPPPMHLSMPPVSSLLEVSMPLNKIAPIATDTKEMLTFGLRNATINLDKAINSENIKNRKSDHNIIISPISIAAAMALILLATAGESKSEVGKFLGFDSTFVDTIEKNENIFKRLGLLLDKFQIDTNNTVGTTQINLAKSIFVQDGYNLTKKYRAMAKELLKSELIIVDFKNNGFQAQKRINQWVSNQTRGKINDILPDIPLPDTKTIIASALYFSGEWETPFLLNYTRVKPFYAGLSAPEKKINRENKDNIYVPTMVGNSEVLYHSNEELGFKAIGIPYKGRKVFMYYVLPNTNTSLRDLVAKMDGYSLQNITMNTTLSEFLYFIPKMTLDSFTNLRPAMQKLGVNKIFDSLQANMINMATDSMAFVSDVLHKVQIVVDEVGTVASAATVVTVSRGGLPVFNVNKPFLFFLHHVESDTIILWGTIYKPMPYTTSPPPPLPSSSPRIKTHTRHF